MAVPTASGQPARGQTIQFNQDCETTQKQDITCTVHVKILIYLILVLKNHRSKHWGIVC